MSENRYIAVMGSAALASVMICLLTMLGSTPTNAVLAQSSDSNASKPLTTVKGEEVDEEAMLLVEELRLISDTSGIVLRELSIAVDHSGFLSEALEQGEQADVRKHAEHVINITVGENSSLFGDADQNGQAQNPGDGIGVITHLDQLVIQVSNVHSDVLTGKASADLSLESKENITALQESLIPLSNQFSNVADLGWQIVAANSIDEASSIYESLQTQVDDADADLRSAISLLREIRSELEPDARPLTVIDVSPNLQEAKSQLASAATQMGIALDHAGFLGTSLGDQDLAGASKHAEHVINIIVGEKDPLFDDLDQNGQIQNPGDGFGLAPYVDLAIESIVRIETQLEEANSPADISQAASDLSALFASIRPDLEEVTSAAIQVLAAEDAAEAIDAHDSIQTRLTNAAKSLQTGESALTVLVDQVGITEADLPSPDTKARELVLVAAEQLNIAIDHVGFMQDALSGDERSDSLIHAEHVVNILDGEEGRVYGDLNQDGSIQNPGDGIGVRTYLEESISEYSILLSDSDLADVTAELQAIIGLLEVGLERIEPTTSTAQKIFATDTTTEATPLAGEIATELGVIAEALQNTLAISLQEESSPKNDKPLLPPVNPDDGAQWLNPRDGSLYIYVAAGPFEIGASADMAVSRREQPNHRLDLPGFWIQQTETTNAQYAACIQAGVCTSPANDTWDDVALANHPVSDVSWAQAIEYAGWVGARLPTESMWEKACRSGDQRMYPWGNQAPDESLANFGNNFGEPLPVGQFPDGATDSGILDMSGNVWEWTTSLDAPYPYDSADGREVLEEAGRRIARGGSFFYTHYQARCTGRTGFESDAKGIGIRLVLPVDGDQWINPLDQAAYVYVAGGEATIGLDESRAVSEREQPAHQVLIPGFWMQQTETTNSQYASCVLAGECSTPGNNLWDRDEFADHPVTDIDWMQATEYANFVGGRLPSEVEWELACRGSDQRLYPWGNALPNADRSNFNNDIGEPVAVGSYLEGASPYGLLDMSGNVWEWTSSLDMAYPYDVADGREDTDSEGKRIMRGGSYYYTRYQISCTARVGFNRTTRGKNFGFRVVVDR